MRPGSGVTRLCASTRARLRGAHTRRISCTTTRRRFLSLAGGTALGLAAVPQLLRERVGVEHTLARLGHVQREVARYRGLRKQLFDTRRAATVIDLQIFDALHQTQQPVWIT